MRIIPIDYTTYKPCVDVSVQAGYVDEKNAVELDITLPNVDDEITSCVLVFSKGEPSKPLFPVNGKVKYVIPPEHTTESLVSFNLECYKGEESIYKANRTYLYFCPTEHTDMEVSSELLAEIAENTKARHTHTNKPTLDKFSEQDGTPLFDGRPIGGGEGGTSDYNLLVNKPKINDVELKGNKTLEELGIQPKGDYATKGELADKADKTDIPTKTSQLQNDSEFATNASVDGKFDVVNNDIQNLKIDKLDVKYEPIKGKEVSQLEARAILESPTEYEDKFIIFMANSGSPTKAVATGFIVNDGEGNTYLSVTDNEGHYKRFNKDNFETFEIIAKDRTKETLALDDLTIDVQGQAGFINSVHNAFNRPENTSTDGIIKVVAYNIENQLQEYTDVKNGYKYVRLVTGTANQHSFGMWQRVDITIENAKVGEAVFVKSVDSNNHPTEYETKAVGSGGAENWEKINEITFNSETGAGEISTDSQGKPFELIKSQLVVNCTPSQGSHNGYLKYHNGTKWVDQAVLTNVVATSAQKWAIDTDVRGEYLSCRVAHKPHDENYTENVPFGLDNTISGARLNISGGRFSAGSKMTLYGVRK